jgi:hypothetical protein
LKTPDHDFKGKASGAALAGFYRSQIVNQFLASSEHDYLLLTDGDVLINGGTVKEAVADYEALDEHLRNKGSFLGMLTLHNWHGLRNEHRVGDEVFADILATGDGAVLFSRRSLEETGNQFSSLRQGNLDRQIARTYAAGGRCCTRYAPAYPVARLTTKLWTDYRTGEPLRPPGFDLDGFRSLVKEKGLEAAVEEFQMKEITPATELVEKALRATGHVVIEAVNVKTGNKKILVDAKNIIVNGLYINTARMLGGDNAANRKGEYMRFGTGTGTEAATDTGLFQPVGPNLALTITFPADGSVKFQATLGESDLVGFPLKEVGLFSNVNLLAHKTFGTITKAQGFIFNVLWTIQWTLA